MPNKNNSFVNEIGNYELIRGLIRYLFQYGDLSNAELAASKQYGSTTNISYHMKRIKNYLADSRLCGDSFKENGRRIKNTRLINDPLAYPINNLTETFEKCVFNVDDLIFYYTVLQLFFDSTNCNVEDYEGDEAEPLFHSILYSNNIFTFKQLSDSFWDTLLKKKYLLYNKGQIKSTGDQLSKTPFSEEKFRGDFNKLKDELGIFINTLSPYSAVKSGSSEINPIVDKKVKDKDNQYFYKLSNDIFGHFVDDPQMLENIYDMVCFFYNHSDIAVPGWQLANTLRTYIYSNYPSTKINKAEIPIYHFTDSNVLNVLDADVFWDAITAVHNHNAISFDYKAQENEYQIIVYPIKVISERQYGRQYLFAYCYSDKAYYIYRLDRMRDIRTLDLNKEEKYAFIGTEKQDDIDKELKNIFEVVFENAWNIDIKNYENPKSVLIHFRKGKGNLEWIKRTVSMKRGNGEIINETDEGFDYRVKVTNTVEIIPWIRQFGAQATVDRDANPELHEKLKNEMMEMLSRYESV